jgi:hypothetical protein
MTLNRNRIAERVAIVTGGGRGLGRAMVLGLVRAGMHVVATAARERIEIEAVAQEAQKPLRSRRAGSSKAKLESWHEHTNWRSQSSRFRVRRRARGRGRLGNDCDKTISEVREGRVPEGRCDRSLARSVWEKRPSKEPSRRVRYNSSRCAHRFDGQAVPVSSSPVKTVRVLPSEIAALPARKKSAGGPVGYVGAIRTRFCSYSPGRDPQLRAYSAAETDLTRRPHWHCWEISRVQVACSLAGGASATAASLVSIRKVKVSCRYKRTAASVWLR